MFTAWCQSCFQLLLHSVESWKRSLESNWEMLFLQRAFKLLNQLLLWNLSIQSHPAWFYLALFVWINCPNLWAVRSCIQWIGEVSPLFSMYTRKSNYFFLHAQPLFNWGRQCSESAIWFYELQLLNSLAVYVKSNKWKTKWIKKDSSITLYYYTVSTWISKRTHSLIGFPVKLSTHILREGNHAEINGEESFFEQKCCFSFLETFLLILGFHIMYSYFSRPRRTWTYIANEALYDLFFGKGGA